MKCLLRARSSSISSRLISIWFTTKSKLSSNTNCSLFSLSSDIMIKIQSCNLSNFFQSYLRLPYLLSSFLLSSLSSQRCSDKLKTSSDKSSESLALYTLVQIGVQSLRVTGYMEVLLISLALSPKKIKNSE